LPRETILAATVPLIDVFSRCAAGAPAVYNAVAMSLSKTMRLLLALVSGVALALAYPSFNIPLLGWTAPALLIVASLGARPRFAFLLGLLQGAVYYALSIPWIYTVLRQYGPLPVIQAGAVFVLLVVVASLFHAAFAGAVAWMSRTCIQRACLAAPLLWVAMEFGLTRMPAIGFPWNLLGYVAAGNPVLVQLTAITGIFGLSLLVASYSALAAWIVYQMSLQKQEGMRLWVGANVVLIVIALVGPRYIPKAAADHVAHLVQTNFPVATSYPNDWMQAHAGEMDELERISVGAAQKSPGPVVWPEVPAPFSLQDVNFEIRAARIAREAGHGFLVGVLDFKPLGGGRSGVTNSAALLGPSGSLDFMYDKIHLVPFSEYVPWRNLFFFAKDLTGIVGDFQAGTEYKVGKIDGGPFGVYICYEATFPNEVRRFTQSGAQLLINISDDGWFGRSSAAAQHLAMARVRAVENRRWLLRDTNNGITVSVDPYGRTVAHLAPNTRGELDAPYAFRSDMTLYARWGDWLAWLCVLGALVLVLGVARDARARRKT
jgi:apolipoprotein N-acyltransferase